MKCARLTAPIELAAEAPNGTRRQFHGTAYSGGLADPGFPVVVDLASTSVVPRVPILFQHRHDETIGVGQLQIGDHQMSAAGELFTDIEERARTLAAKADAGLPLQMSIGVFGVTEERFPTGKTAKVNGREFAGPVTVLRNGLVREVSFVTLGADAATSAHVFELPSGDAGPSPLAATLPPDHTERGPTPMDITQLQARVAELASQVSERDQALSAMTAERDQATSQLAELQSRIEAEAKAAREKDVRATLSAVGIKPEDDAVAAYVGLSADAWARVKQDMESMRRRAPEHLFSEQATDGTAGDQQEHPMIADAKRRAAAAAHQAQ